MRVLAVETATSWHSVAIVDDDRVLARHDQDGTGAHAQMLLPTIDRLLAEAGLRLADLEGLACSIGPGSFTGIRVGLATCLGLRAAIDRPLALVPTLEAMAWPLKDERFPLCPVVTSRKGEVYWAVFRWKAGSLERIVPEHVGSPAALAESLKEPTILFGNGWTALSSSGAGRRRRFTSCRSTCNAPRPSSNMSSRGASHRWRGGRSG
jgi:tRNA threonylcarbamoyladenosine biosynthesis protein TsaB